MPDDLTLSAFDDFLAGFDTQAFRDEIAKSSGRSEQEINAALDIYFNEMRFGLSFVAERLRLGDRRILEIGSGLGLLSLFLAQQGYEVYAVEPAAQGFDLFVAARQAVETRLPKDVSNIVFLTCGAEDLTPDLLPPIDFAFSVNVMEHMSELEEAVRAGISVLSETGVWCNSCPNYAVPYEPHFAIPLVPFWPQVTRHFVKRRIAQDGPLWASFNFITARRLRRLVTRHGGQVTLEKAVLYRSLKRLESDPEFAKRHMNGVIGRFLGLLFVTRAVEVFKFIPPGLSTPMNFAIGPTKRR